MSKVNGSVQVKDHTLEVPKFEGNVANTQLVAVRDDRIIVMKPQIEMTREEALMHAATIVALTDKTENFEEFRGILKAVLET
jgi:hypothetical protein